MTQNKKDVSGSALAAGLECKEPAASASRIAELENLVVQLQKQLSQTQRLATIGELTSTTTHEFNNLLMTIMNYAKLGMRHKDEPTRDKAFSKIVDASNRAAKVTQTILGLARNRSGVQEPTALEPVIRDTLVLLERELHRYRIMVETEFDAVPMALVEANQIQRVLINLLTNARQAIGESGSIKLRLSYEAKQQHVVLMIRDSGKGIAKENLPKIFEPFFSTKIGPDASGKGGTGLGLSACREIIEEHRGKIRVESSVGKGTAFYIRLPAVVANIERASA
ncbi:MAG: ATP-binding protein [Pirellulaceae bacterium]|nr:ATP-binding protein [Pirellulaceae bacterium]